MASTINPNWNRWITASLIDHFNAMRQDVPFYVEGQTRPTTVSDYAEFRIDGPLYNEINSNYWIIDITAAIILTVVKDETDIYKLDRYTGIFLAAFTTDIPVFRYGDDNERLGCFKLSPLMNERIRVDKFNQISVATPVNQQSIEAHYTLTLRL